MNTQANDREYGSPHFSEGGDAITNFSPEQLPLYERAIRLYGVPSLYVGPPTPRGFTSDFALRQRGGVWEDLSDFWRLFDRLKKEDESRDRLRTSHADLVKALEACFEMLGEQELKDVFGYEWHGVARTALATAKGLE